MYACSHIHIINSLAPSDMPLKWRMQLYNVLRINLHRIFHVYSNINSKLQFAHDQGWRKQFLDGQAE